MAHATDPIAAQSKMLCTYMSMHPDTLLAYVAFGSGCRTARDAKMQSIDSNGVTMSYTDGGVAKTTRLSFDPPLRSTDEVRRRLVALKEEAEQATGMVPRPTIDTFVWPTLGQIGPPALLMLLLLFATSPRGEVVRSRVGGWRPVQAGWALMIVAHVLEASYTRMLCRRHKTSARDTRKWVIVTFLFGFPAIQTFRRLVREARIASLSEAAGSDKTR